MPTTGLPPARANSVGLPGRMSMPWNRMPGGSRSASASAVRSFVPTEEPPDRITASWSSSSRAIARRSALASSGTMPAWVTSQPAAVACAPSAVWLASRTWPGRGVSAGSHSSLPVDSTATRGRRWTATVVTPKVASIARSCGRRRRPAGSTAAPRARSSPRWTTLAPGATAREISTRAPPSSAVVCSTITTASAPSGRKPPVEMATASPAPTPRGNTSPIGTVPVTPASPAARGRAPDVGAAHRVAVHDGAALARQIGGRRNASASTRPTAAPSGRAPPDRRRVGQDPARLVRRNQA